MSSGAITFDRDATQPTWTDIAYELGYYDQMDMVHDFRRFSGKNPNQFSERFTAMLERWS